MFGNGHPKLACKPPAATAFAQSPRSLDLINPSSKPSTSTAEWSASTLCPLKFKTAFAFSAQLHWGEARFRTKRPKRQPFSPTRQFRGLRWERALGRQQLRMKRQIAKEEYFGGHGFEMFRKRPKSSTIMALLTKPVLSEDGGEKNLKEDEDDGREEVVWRQGRGGGERASSAASTYRARAKARRCAQHLASSSDSDSAEAPLTPTHPPSLSHAAPITSPAAPRLKKCEQRSCSFAAQPCLPRLDALLPPGLCLPPCRHQLNQVPTGHADPKLYMHTKAWRSCS
eukprot:945818-Rhodomonas_salina.4